MAKVNMQQMIKKTDQLLSEYRNTKKVISILQRRGVDDGTAKQLIKMVISERKKGIRKSAAVKMIGGLSMLIVFGGIYYFTGRFFYIIIPISAISFGYGLFQMIFAVGYEPE